jgi:hypothetical protein
VHTSHGHHYGHERHEDSSAQQPDQGRDPGHSAYGHGHGRDQDFTPPGHAAHENWSHGRGHDH